MQDVNESLRRALIEQSARLFRVKGYGNTTVRDIAAAAGVQAGSGFYHLRHRRQEMRNNITY